MPPSHLHQPPPPPARWRLTAVCYSPNTRALGSQGRTARLGRESFTACNARAAPPLLNTQGERRRRCRPWSLAPAPLAPRRRKEERAPGGMAAAAAGVRRPARASLRLAIQIRHFVGMLWAWLGPTPLPARQLDPPTRRGGKEMARPESCARQHLGTRVCLRGGPAPAVWSACTSHGLLMCAPPPVTGPVGCRGAALSSGACRRADCALDRGSTHGRHASNRRTPTL